MNSKNLPNTATKNLLFSKTASVLGMSLYIIVLGIFSVLLLVEPEWFDVRSSIVILIVALFCTALPPAAYLASKSKTKTVATVGTVALTIMFTFLGIFVVAAVGWFNAVSYAQ